MDVDRQMSLDEFLEFHDKGLFLRVREYYKYSHIVNCLYRQEKTSSIRPKMHTVVYIVYEGREVHVCQMKEDDGERASALVQLIMDKRNEYIRGGTPEKMKYDL